MGKSVLVHGGKFLKMYNADGSWEFVSRKDVPYRDGNHKADAVVIIPMVVNDGELNIVCIDEYRPPMGCWVVGFPAGLIDEGEKPSDTAVRELFEETGLRARMPIVHNTPPMFSSEGLTDECVSVYYLACEGEVSSQYLQDNEQIEARVINREDAKDLLDMPMGKVAYMVLQDFVNTGFSWMFEKHWMNEVQDRLFGGL